MKRNLFTVLFFISGPVPTEAQKAEADEMVSGKVKVSFRNALYVAEGDSLERCNFVAGDVPHQYVKAGYKNFSDYEADISGKTDSTVETAPETPEQAAIREQREQDNSQAKQATVAQLKVALGQLNIAFTETDKKADLLKFYLNRP